MPSLIDPSLRDKMPAWANASPDLLSSLARKAYEETLKTPPLNSPNPHDFLLTHGNRLDSIHIDGPNIYREFMECLAKARYSVDISFFKFDPESLASRLIGHGIKMAAQVIKHRPLVVRMIIDDWKYDLNRAIDNLYDAVKSWNIPVVEFDDLGLPIPVPFKNITFQLATYPHANLGILHEKFIIVDCRTLLLTGANPERVHDLPSPWRDTGYVLSGPVALTAAAWFDEAWHHHAKHWECKKRTLKKDCQATQHSTKQRIWPAGEIFPKGETSLMLAGRASRASLIGNNESPQTATWRAIMANATTEIRIISPNIDCTPFEELVVQAVQRGVKVKVLTSKGFNDTWPDQILRPNSDVLVNIRQKLQALSSEAINNFEARWFSQDGHSPVVGNGNGASHTKFLSADHAVAVIGSGNMDFMSWANAREFNLLFDNISDVNRLDNTIFLPDWNRAINA